MFTGIVEGTGVIKSINGNEFVISHPFGNHFEVGESVALSGMCATVLESSDNDFRVEIIEESRKLTVFSTLEVEELVNLERSALIGGRNSGHNVTGHIDQAGEVLDVEKVQDYQLLRIKIDPENRKYLVYKGSVAINGVSLTVSGVSKLSDSKAWFEVSLISHTWTETNLHRLNMGDLVNLEFDIFGKYVLNYQD